MASIIVRVQRPKDHPEVPWHVYSRDRSINQYIEPERMPGSVREKLRHQPFAHFHVVRSDRFDALVFGSFAGDLPW